ncbi:hypothetical protein PoB_007444300 [Plakobranchus ocellatus]|uniref:Uncharacterized protein n=1 Tax=Plakobranchus ocellatus TaxID=259542 RepID=A0AAV4DUA6_9GAST|nr:hypothetical protein PoB_007444300 [Plakobranchus ocellatus]
MPVSPRVETADSSVYPGINSFRSPAHSRFPPLTSQPVRQPETQQKEQIPQNYRDNSNHSLNRQMPLRQQSHTYIQRNIANSQVQQQQQYLHPFAAEPRISGYRAGDNKNSSFRADESSVNGISAQRGAGTNQSSKGYGAGEELTLRVTTLSPYAYSIYTNAIGSNNSSAGRNTIEGAIHKNIRNMYSNNSNSYLIKNPTLSYFGLSATGTSALTAPAATSALRPRKASSRLRLLQQQQQQQQQQQHLNHQHQGKTRNKGRKAAAVTTRSQITVDDAVFLSLDMEILKFG